MPSGKIQSLVGDTPVDRNQIPNPFHLHFTSGFRQWLAQERVSLALTTYEGGKLIIIGPGLQGGTVVTERNFERCMASRGIVGTERSRTPHHHRTPSGR